MSQRIDSEARAIVEEKSHRGQLGGSSRDKESENSGSCAKDIVKVALLISSGQYLRE